MTFGYNADVAFGQSTAEILDHAKSLLASLVDKREEPKEIQRPLIFIARSLGGIVVQQALFQARLEARYQSIKDATLGLIFMGTPHRGSDKATYGKVLANVAQFIVEKHSALLEAHHEEQIPVDADHSTTCKFETDQNDTFEQVFKRVKRMKNKSQRDRAEQSLTNHRDLLHAIETQDLAGVLANLSAGTDPGTPDSLGRTPVHKAIAMDNTDIMHALLEHGARLDTRDHYGETPLDVAARRGHSHIITTTIKRALLANQIEGSTALHSACFWGRRDEVQTILANASNPSSAASATDVYNATPLHYAIFSRDAQVVHTLISAGADVNIVSTHWGTALHKAAFAGMAKAVTMLMQAGSSINAIKPVAKWTPLGLAVFNNQVEVAIVMQKLAIERGSGWQYNKDLISWELQHVPAFLEKHFS
ncbi:hypothetical protein LTR07_002565 [Exophiala xenobiotica]|nr:hypothetical protein LTR07_002565 [Exophiala xenobiotica]